MHAHDGDANALVKEVLAKNKFTQSAAGTADGVAATQFVDDLAGDTAGHVDVWLDASGLPVTAPPADQILTEQDQISFAIPGQQFAVSGDPLNGSTFPPGAPVKIGTFSSTGFGQSVCIPVSGLPAPGQPSRPIRTSEPSRPTPTSVCVTLSAPASPTHS